MKNVNLLTILNSIGIVGVLIVNSLANILPINDVTTGDVSAQYQNLFTPAGYTFSIWSIIFLGLMAFGVYQFLPFFQKRYSSHQKVVSLLGITLFINLAANAMWIYAWHFQQFTLSILIMFLILSSLIDVNRRLYEYERSNKSLSKWYNWTVKWPLGLYLGWICVATIANVAVYLTFLEWDMAGLSPYTWGTIMLIVSGAIAILLMYKWQNLPAILAIAWGVIGIYFKRYHINDFYSPYMLIALSIVMIIMLAASLLINRKSIKSE